MEDVQQAYTDQDEVQVEYAAKESDVKKFQKELDRRMSDAKRMMLYKHDMLADQFQTHETHRRVSCSYTIGGPNRKKTPAQAA